MSSDTHESFFKAQEFVTLHNMQVRIISRENPSKLVFSRWKNYKFSIKDYWRKNKFRWCMQITLHTKNDIMLVLSHYPKGSDLFTKIQFGINYRLFFCW